MQYSDHCWLVNIQYTAQAWGAHDAVARLFNLPGSGVYVKADWLIFCVSKRLGTAFIVPCSATYTFKN